MLFLIILVFIVLIISVILTLVITGKSDENYRSSVKRNTINLSLIYIVIIVLSLIALGGYIWWQT
ncbi:hypothetical protein DOE78_14030 [Bacillus sp. Y1]|jgi:cytochrome bd-type quinol oxidase subunit 2|nr:hypothetical protein DOE78_14030 [Bacillus sp. Y1]